MSIWYNKLVRIEDIHHMGKDTIASLIGMRFEEIGPDYLVASIPVDERTKQPFGLLHGGASAVLAETLGSVASYLCVNGDRKMTVGIELNCNHIKGVREGRVTGRATPIHIGGSTQVWDIRIVNNNGALVCVSRLTVMVVDKK